MKSVKIPGTAAGIRTEWLKMSETQRRLALCRQIELRLSYLPPEAHVKWPGWKDYPLHRLEILLVQLKDLKGW